jgi:hypothetical protein
MLTPSQMALCRRVYLQKGLAVKAPRDLYTLASSQGSYKERKKLPWLAKVD